MYDDSDLQSAVEAGILSAETADALRSHIAGLHAAPAVDEEHFRLLTGFNDIFVAIALILMGVALGLLGGAMKWPGADPFAASPAAGLLIAAASWPLAEYFTRKRRMALPSILLLLGFVGGIFLAVAFLLHILFPDNGERSQALAVAASGLCAAIAAGLHWQRFKVPITIAAGAAACASIVIGLIGAAFPDLGNGIYVLVLIAGVIIFAYAMHWDMSDPARTTRQSDVAFWLHLTAAPMIAHATFALLNVFSGNIGTGKALIVILLYAIFGIVALAVDRRALLVSSLVYVLAAIYSLIERMHAVGLSSALTALVIGSSLLLLSALWHRARVGVIGALPADIARRLPPVVQPVRTATA